MRTMTIGMLLLAALANPAQADIYVSVSASGGYVLSNVHRPGKHYDRVVAEPAGPGLAAVAASSRPQMIADLPYADMVAAAASANDLPQALLHAVIKAESNYRPRVRSAKGAGGLMQLMPGTARDMGVRDVLDPAANIQGGARYLKHLMKLFDNDIKLAVAAYNAGPDAVISRGRIVPPFAETRRYVPTVLRQYRRLQGLADDAPL
ncbi:lytic transglycosylase domain-containing protein [Pseudomonas sp. R5(2019)]|uniref:lytic transglycosylase domain-containing protein n=1 Tax=Pseudomonas sp. R5(2019) TaxID=2697566 RepID=UPI001411E96E|nr:lytic transglycosylase domain-containing protein [Pseudomonas sp. R5(2019)]NBA96744.1 transglycosylase SLT domain-containing protein [Pseudomonas sp. R5(2019)]